MSEMIRAFIAIDLGDELRGRLAQVGQELEKHIPAGSVRWVKPSAMHLTLVFLGDTPAGRLPAIEAAMRTAAAQLTPITLSATGLGCFPNPRRPRVVWVGVQEPAGLLPPLKRQLDQALKPLGYRPEDRPFAPHLTLGRISRNASLADARRVGQAVESTRIKEVGAINAAEYYLIRSQLRPQGPLYTTLASVPLG